MRCYRVAVTTGLDNDSLTGYDARRNSQEVLNNPLLNNHTDARWNTPSTPAA